MTRRKSAAIGLALSAAVAGAMVAQPALADQKSGPAGSSDITFQSPAANKALVAQAQAQAPAMVKALGLSTDDRFTVTSVIKDADGATHVRVQRTFKGLAVVGGDLVIHRDASGAVTGHDGTFDATITIPTTPKLKAADAMPRGLAGAKEHKAKHKHGLKTAKATGSSLVIVGGSDGAQSLAWSVTTTGTQEDSTPSRITTLVDATSGKAMKSYDQITAGTGNGIYDGRVNLATTSQGGLYYLQNPTNGNYSTDAHNRQADGDVFTRSTDTWGNGSNSSRESAAVDAQFGADKTFDFYKNVLGRNGIWNNGQGARSRVHYDTNYTNAFWDGSQMTYGDGANNANPLTELDVAAHEMTHGVTENTAGLVYSGDAGGLNEATSDIFGTAVEWYAALPSDNPDYLMGEAIDLNGDGTPLRYMDRPSKDGASFDCWTSSVGSADPHLSSGPLNHWYYLASEGSGAKTINGVAYNSPTCNGGSVAGAGHGTIEKVWYRALATRLTSNSTYRSAREAAITSAIELYGASSQACASVEKGFDAINVPKGTAACSSSPQPSQTPTSSPTSGPTSTPAPGGGIVNGGFEQGQTGWTGTQGPITDDAGQPAHTGTWKMWLGGNGSTSSEYEQQQVTVPASGRLTYWVGIGTDETTTTQKYDRATVSVNGTTVASYSNLDATSSYVQKTIDLSAYAGRSVTLKFSATEDSSAPTSFVFDDITLS